MTSTAARFGASYAALTAAHEVGDYWAQRDKDAVAKGRPGWEGRLACARHVGSYSLVGAAALAAANRGLRLGIGWRRAATALALSAFTHYAADRAAGHWQEPEPANLIVRLAQKKGSAEWLRRDPGAGPLLDQAWHKGWIAIAAAVATWDRTER